MLSEEYEGVVSFDIGTIYSRVAIWEGDNAKVIADRHGNRAIPSCVAFAENGDILVGQNALEHAGANPRNTAFASKQLLGMPFNDPIVSQVSELHSFYIIESEHGRPSFQIQCGGVTKDWAPEEITALLLLELKKMAETYLGKSVKKAVLTVSPTLCVQKKYAMLDAARIAGLEFVQLLNDTAAAAITYKIKNINDIGTQRNIILVSFGGGSVFVSLMSIGKTVIEEKCTYNCFRTGGEDFTRCLVNHCADEFMRKNDGKDICENSRAKQRLRMACEQAKRRLSAETEVTIELKNFVDGVPFKTTITRDAFETLCTSVLHGIGDQVHTMQKHIKKNNIVVDEVVVLGGCARIPMVQELLSQLFDANEKPNMTLNLDESFVSGAAAHAFILSGERSAEADNLKLCGVMMSALSIRSVEDESHSTIIIDPHTPLPVEKSVSYMDLCATGCESVQVFNKSSTLTLSTVAINSDDAPNTEITFSVDASGILTVWAREANAEKCVPLPVKHALNLAERDVEQMTKEMAEYNEHKKKRDQEKLQQERVHIKMLLGGEWDAMSAKIDAQGIQNARLTKEVEELREENEALRCLIESFGPRDARDVQRSLLNGNSELSNNSNETCQSNVDNALNEVRMGCIADQRLILKEESDSRAERVAGESSGRCELNTIRLAHLEWANDRIMNRKRIEMQETMERELETVMVEQKLEIIRQVGKEQLAIMRQEWMERMKKVGRRWMEEKQEIAALQSGAAKYQLENYGLKMLSEIRDARTASQISETEHIIRAIEEVLAWVRRNPGAVKTECEQRLNTLKSVCAPIESLTPRSADSFGEWRSFDE